MGNNQSESSISELYNGDPTETSDLTSFKLLLEIVTVQLSILCYWGPRFTQIWDNPDQGFIEKKYKSCCE